MRVVGNVDRASVLVLEKNLLPILAAIRCAEDATLRIWPVSMSQRGHESDVGILRIDDHLADNPAVAQSNIFPRFAAIERLVDSIDLRNVSPNACLAGSDI